MGDAATKNPKFTPGPWEAQWSTRTNGGPKKGWHVFDQQDKTLIDINDHGTNPEADAHLVAAAPELYAACRRLLLVWQQPEDSEYIEWDDIQDVVTDAMWAVQKADGDSEATS